MKCIQLLCAAKINLSLDIVGKRSSGYHDLESIFQSVGVYDTISVYIEEGTGIALTCNVPGIPCDERNLAFRAAAAFLEASGRECRAAIRLEKEIPSGAGMGGGSADAAGVLYALNILLDGGFSNAELQRIGLQLGADVPFMLLGGTALARGVGEQLTSLSPLPELPLVILKGSQSISTAAAYAAVDSGRHFARPDTKALLRAVEEQDIRRLAEGCCNVFESVTECADVQRARKTLREFGALQAVMTGSGSAVFGIFENFKTAGDCAHSLRGKFPFVRACTAVKTPFVVLRTWEE